MDATAPRFAVVEGPAGAGGFASAVLGRLRPAHLLWPLGLLLALRTFGPHGFIAYGVNDNDWLDQPALLHESVAIVLALFAALAADEAVARGARRLPAYALAMLLAMALATALQYPLVKLFHIDPIGGTLDTRRIELLMHLYFIDLRVALVGCFVYVNRRTARLALARTHSAQLARDWARRRTLESQLQAMQARVEPQFLFNTLAQVRELYERDAPLGARMLDDLIAYLRAALPHLRESSSTLGQEIELARAWLDIMRVRLGDRLAFAIDAPEVARRARMPPMTLLPLIGHALVRAQQSGAPGCAIRVEARAESGRLRLGVTDSGVGFVSEEHERSRSIGERLQALYGEDGRFALERLREHAGTRATVEIPYEELDSDRGDR